MNATKIPGDYGWLKQFLGLDNGVQRKARVLALSDEELVRAAQLLSDPKNFLPAPAVLDEIRTELSARGLDRSQLH